MKRIASAVCLLTIVAVTGCTHVTRVQPAASPEVTIVTPPGTTAVVVQPAPPWCNGAYNPATGTNFGACVQR